MTTLDTALLAKGWGLIAEGAETISLAYSAIEQPARTGSTPGAPSPVDDLPPLTDEDAPLPGPSEDERLAAVLAATGGEVVPAAPAAKRGSAFTECPAHHRPWTAGKFGDYCQSSSEEDGWSNPKGFCTVTPRSAGAWLKQHPKVVA